MLREKNKQKVTERIVASAMELFKAHGCEQTTMDDIAAKAEISRATLFNYFPSKDALMIPWVQEIIDEFVRPGLNEYLATQPTTIDTFRLLFTNMSKGVLEAPDLIRAFINEAIKPKNKSEMERTRTGMLEIFAQVLRYGQTRGEVRSDIPVENMAAYISALQSGLLFHVLESLLETEQTEDPGEFIDQMMLFIGAGLTTPAK